jgi:hypothetical protein
LNENKNNICTWSLQRLKPSTLLGEDTDLARLRCRRGYRILGAAAPQGRECVVVLNARISDEGDRKVIEHLIDTFEVDCGRATS